MKALTAILTISLCALVPARAQADQAALQALVAKKAAIVELMHGKAKKALVTAAQDETFKEYFSTDSEDRRAHLKQRIDHISLHVQSRFHVEEMCLIDPAGAEVSRIVGNEIAYDLSSEEASNIFFRPSFDQAPRKVYISPIYISADVDVWVVAYATPILVRNEKKAILHYEHNLGSYQSALNKNLSNTRRYLLAVTEDDWIISDSRKAIAIAKRDDSEEPATYFEAFEVSGLRRSDLMAQLGAGASRGSGELTLNGDRYAVAYEVVEHWTLIAFERL